jgi:hypothetical protein
MGQNLSSCWENVFLWLVNMLNNLTKCDAPILLFTLEMTKRLDGVIKYLRLLSLGINLEQFVVLAWGGSPFKIAMFLAFFAMKLFICV